MVDRKPKLIAASAVLTIGVGLAMLFRRTEPQVAIPASIDAPSSATLAAPDATSIVAPTAIQIATPTVTPTPLEGQRSPLAPVPASNVGLTAGVGLPASAAPSSAATIIPAAMAAASTPDIQAAPSSPMESTSGGRPIYATDAAPSEPAASPHQIHVVHEGDSLERLAERYLADGGRSLELFDLNRDVLDNPHLLPIGAELKIPVAPAAGD